MGRETRPTFEIDITEHLQEMLQDLATAEAGRLAAMSPEERAHWEAVQAEHDRLRDEDRKSYEALVEPAQRIVRDRHRQILKDRRAGVVGTLTEIGRIHGESAIALGRILKSRGLREPVTPEVDELDLVPQAERQHAAECAARWASFCERHPDMAPSRQEPEPYVPRQYSRGVLTGWAVWDPIDDREFWVAAKVAELLAALLR